MATQAHVGTGRPARDSLLIGHRGGDGRAAPLIKNIPSPTGAKVVVTSGSYQGTYTQNENGAWVNDSAPKGMPLPDSTMQRWIAEGKAKNKSFDSTDLLSFMRHVKTACNLTHPDRGYAHEVLKSHFGSTFEKVVTKAAMGENSGMIGGYLLPTAISLQLLKSLAERSFIYPRALQVQMSTREVNAPIFDLSQGAAGQSPFVGGMSFTWGSASVPAEDDPTFGNVNLTAWDLIGYTRISNQLLADAGPEAERLYVELFAMAAAVQAEYAFMQGTGAGGLMPLGVIPSPCAIKVARTTPSQIAQADVANMAGKMIPLGWRNAIWVVNPSALPQLFKVTGFQPNMPGEGDGCCGHLFTRPVFVSEKASALGTMGDLTFFDPSLYVVGMRDDVLVSASEHSRFQNYQTEFMVVLRGDGKPLMNNSVTLMDGSTTASMVVVLQ